MQQRVSFGDCNSDGRPLLRTDTMYTEAFAAARSVDASSGGKCTASNCGARHPMEMDLRASGGVTSWWSKQPSLFPFGYGLSCERSSQRPCSAEASAVPPALSAVSVAVCRHQLQLPVEQHAAARRHDRHSHSRRQLRLRCNHPRPRDCCDGPACQPHAHCQGKPISKSPFRNRLTGPPSC